jgi:hypothetical protein
VIPARLEVLKYWINERENIRRKRDAGQPKPWANDPYMANTRWCNVRRMDDKVSRWLMSNFYDDKLMPAGDAVTAATVARLINWPDTLVELYPQGWPDHWDARRFVSRLQSRRKAGRKVFTGVYIINAAGATDADRANGGAKILVVSRTISEVWRMRDGLVDPDSMQATHERLCGIKGLGSFMAGQIVADLRHITPGAWHDRHTWAPRGPGSARGLTWLTGSETILTERAWQAAFKELLTTMPTLVPEVWVDRKLEAHDVQNCLCELSKFVRVLDNGRSKNKYDGGIDA